MGKTDENLETAFAGESQANRKYLAFSKKALEEGHPQIAKLFRVISRSEEIHGIRCLGKLKEIKSTEENLQDSFESEIHVAGVGYDSFIRVANEANDDGASLIFSQARDVEEIHAKLYREAMNHMMEERETTYYVCNVCGYVSDSVLPDNCPICGVGKDKFSEFE